MKKFQDYAKELSGGHGLPTSFGSFDGREQQCLEYVRSAASASRSPAAVIKAIDEYCYKSKWMMNVGDVKGKILEDCLDRVQPLRVLELGTYVGYSALKMIQRLPSDASIVTVDIDARAIEVARAMFDIAGVGSRITVVQGHLQSAETVAQLSTMIKRMPSSAVDFVFVDHFKEAYLPDLKVILRQGWLRPGGVVVADNVLFPGAPDYKKFMEENEGRLFKTKAYKTFVEYQDKIPDLVLESHFVGSGENLSSL